MFPKTVLASAKIGLLLWFNKVVPSLLPFLIGTSLLNQLGFASFLGVLFSVPMQRLFKTSGRGAYPFAIGLFSGYPIGAKTVCELRSEGLLARQEAQRLLGFCNNSGPLFILGTVASAMLLNEKIGFLLLFIHFLSALLTGIFLSLFAKASPSALPEGTGFKKAISELIVFRQKNKRPIGEIMSISVKTSMESILQIGGFIILFSVLGGLISPIFDYLGLGSELKGFFMGIIEITNGCYLLADNVTTFKICLMIALISWGGFSIHAQTLAIISKTDLNSLYYVLCKLLQGLIAFLLSLMLSPVINYIIAVKKSFNPQSLSKLALLRVASLNLLWVIIGLLGLAMVNCCLFKLSQWLNNRHKNKATKL